VKRNITAQIGAGARKMNRFSCGQSRRASLGLAGAEPPDGGQEYVVEGCGVFEYNIPEEYVGISHPGRPCLTPWELGVRPGHVPGAGSASIKVRLTS
jgi:hypothetical protein